MEVKVREARKGEMKEVIRIFEESFTGSYRYWAVRDLPYTYVLVAEIGGEVVGAAELYCKRTHEYGRVGVIYFLAVRRSYRGRGVGSLLVKEAEKLFRSWGCRYSAASTQSSNRASLTLFKKLGYRVYRKNTREFGTLVSALYAYEDDVIFLKEL